MEVALKYWEQVNNYTSNLHLSDRMYEGKEVPWKGCFPKVPEDFVWEDFGVFIPMIACIVGSGLIFVLIFGRRHSFFDKVILLYLYLSLWIHFGLERYYVHYNDTILDKGNNNLIARIWRHYGVSDTRWHGQQPDVDRAVYGCMYGLEFLAAYLCGPTVALTVLCYITKSSWRWVIQPVAVTAQAYGLFITWLPAYWEGLRSVPVHDNFLYYGYYIGWQFPWALIPVLMVLQAGYNVHCAFSAAAKKTQTKQTKKPVEPVGKKVKKN